MISWDDGSRFRKHNSPKVGTEMKLTQDLDCNTVSYSE